LRIYCTSLSQSRFLGSFLGRRLVLLLVDGVHIQTGLGGLKGLGVFGFDGHAEDQVTENVTGLFSFGNVLEEDLALEAS
jgi:hypothetical protein